jgi:type IV pilus assembly protein PilE
MMRSRNMNVAKGFTLIELMVVVAVVAILAAIAIPSYQDSVRKSRRGQVKADIVELAQRAERWHTINNTYVGFWATVPAGERVSPRTGGSAAYNIDMVEAANTFVFTAIPQGGQTADVRCMTLTLDQAGVKTKSGSGALSDCW